MIAFSIFGKNLNEEMFLDYIKKIFMYSNLE